MNYLVSVITPSYNSKKFLSQAIESVLAQTYNNWELLIIDDCSNDGSKEVIKDYIRKDNRIKLIQLEKNSGPAVARNEGIKIANGRYIAFLDSNDLWLPQKLEEQVKFMIDNDLAFTYSSYYLIDKYNNNFGCFVVKDKISYCGILKTCDIGCLTAIYDSQKIGKEYMENVGHEDYTLWLKIIKKIGYSYGIRKPLASYRILENSVSRNKIKSALWQWNIYRKIEKLNIVQSVYYFINYVYYGAKKYK